eukprot:5599346-Amphidinium_carterae.1
MGNVETSDTTAYAKGSAWKDRDTSGSKVWLHPESFRNQRIACWAWRSLKVATFIAEDICTQNGTAKSLHLAHFCMWLAMAQIVS